MTVPWGEPPEAAMHIFALLLALLATGTPAQAQFKSYFDISKVEIEGLTEPNWLRKRAADQLLYMCVQSCPMPTGIAIKGVIRAEKIQDAFATGELSPAALTAEGQANAERLGSEFMGATAREIGGIKAVHMETMARGMFFVTKFFGRGDRLIDIKVTSPSLELARKLSDETAAALVGQVFK